MNQAAGYRKAQPRSSEFVACPRDAKEIIKNFLQALWCNSWSSVRHRDANRIRLFAGRWRPRILGTAILALPMVPVIKLGGDPSGSASGRVFPGVLKKVRNNLLDLKRIKRKGRQIVRAEEIKGNAFLLEQRKPDFVQFR